MASDDAGKAGWATGGGVKPVPATGATAGRIPLPSLNDVAPPRGAS
jgi:hypothetical protein